MADRVVVDTNIFLEILLDQSRRGLAESFLSSNLGTLAMTDFALHSIGVTMVRLGERPKFESFLCDALPRVDVLALPHSELVRVSQHCDAWNLDFDDSYQLTVAESHDLELVTLDSDFAPLVRSHRIRILR